MENKKFTEKTLDEVLQDKIFIDNFKELFEQLKEKRNSRPSPPQNSKYKRDWYDRMRDQIGMSGYSVLENVKSVIEHKSTLSSELKYIIEDITTRAFVKTIKHYENGK